MIKEGLNGCACALALIAIEAVKCYFLWDIYSKAWRGFKEYGFGWLWDHHPWVTGISIFVLFLISLFLLLGIWALVYGMIYKINKKDAE